MFSLFQSLDDQLAQAERELGRAEIQCDNARVKMDQAKQNWQDARTVLKAKQEYINDIKSQIRAEEQRKLNGGDGFFGSLANLLFGDFDAPQPPVAKPQKAAANNDWLNDAVYQANQAEQRALAKEQADANLARELANDSGGIDAQKKALRDIEKAHQQQKDEALAKALAQQDEGGMLAQKKMMEEIEKENQIRKDEELARALEEEEYAYDFQPSAPSW